MKTIKKIIGGLAAVLMLGSFVACNQNTDDNSGTEEEKYYISFNEDTTNLKVDVGSSITLTVKESKGTWKVADNNSLAINVTKTTVEGVTAFTIVGVAENSDAYFTLYPEEAGDSDVYDQKFNVNVYDPCYKILLTLPEDVAASASTISVKYSNDGTEDVYDAVVTYTAGQKSAIVSFEKANANSYNWINDIVVTVKDADGNEIKVSQSASYFCYSAGEADDGYLKSIELTAFEEKTMTFNVTFTGFTPATATITYGYDDTIATADVTLAEDKASGTFEVSNSYINAGGYLEIKGIAATDADGNDISSTIELKADNAWFEFVADGSAALEYAVKSEYTQLYSASYTGSSTALEVDISALKDLTVNTILIEAKNCDWTGIASGDSWWIYAGESLAWQSNDYYKVAITDADTIASLKEAGVIQVTATTGLQATLVISYN